MREQPTAQYGQREWTSLAPEMRRSSARFFAAATSKPSGLARGTSAMPAVPAAPSFRKSRRVISFIELSLFYSGIFEAARRAVDFSPDERVLRVPRQAVEEGGRTAGGEDRRARSGSQGRRGAAGTGSCRISYEGAPLRLPRHLHPRDRRRAIARSESPGCRCDRGVHPRSPRGAGARGAEPGLGEGLAESGAGVVECLRTLGQHVGEAHESVEHARVALVASGDPERP